MRFVDSNASVKGMWRGLYLDFLGGIPFKSQIMNYTKTLKYSLWDKTKNAVGMYLFLLSIFRTSKEWQ